MTPSTALARVLLDELVRGGVREVVLAPGSRSAPLAYAAHAAEAAGRLRLHVRVDERSAAFLALGLARGSGAPVVVVTTSGTAVANLHPAVLEAHHGRVPLVVLSADRPHELRGTGANQTTRQPGLFAGATRLDADLPAPDVAPDRARAAWLRSTVCRALVAATGATGTAAGPVHLDVGFRDPLVPGRADEGVEVDDSGLPEDLAGRAAGVSWVTVAEHTRRPASRPLDRVARTLVLVGDLPPGVDATDAVTWAARRGHPVVAEPFGPGAVREAAVPHGSLLLTATDWVDAHAPDRVVLVGRPTLSRAVGALLRRPGLVVEAVPGDPEWADPSHVVSRVHPWTVLAADTPDEVAEVSVPPAGDDDRAPFALAWADAGRAVADAVAADPPPWPTGPAVARAVAAALPEGATLVVGSSNPVRDLDLGVAGPAAMRVVANRGLAGIDGLVSTAAGVALAVDAPTYALLGDLTLLHDANGLAVGPHEPVPDLTVVVADDDGGGIFSTLEPGAPDHAGPFERVFATPTGTDLDALCRAHGVRYDEAGTADDLTRLLGERPDGLRVVRVGVDRTTHRGTHERLREVAARALTALEG
ncbi:2-succinyl-5-enolpyruvyl-6-hydroxy-3-cyclohexene-1-carboxylic-acid synthase [Phycicoccus sp. BSK3Z-2]|uniref:2-succinyl-5-enolpyruvyl-6-hydroxy-3-cyclohexene-1-carboxylate synthase n=1 Tax=Phycicoccus avicenniae TaxID=2828860 RepID=A0A941DBD4_9MICO|nr:2-succinyl-5-enolpyruvyl-6-hydroxy-3-cyclohexene-1-carboxylic-acid synthase [Phycicoccus avicenniae]MBR7743277.1 2-succinyl-5-enolpyruvyl-6-hydroxy-3-cyclohexene-1-carboxylic-acid synthase [Phycicoccus avicenniae]